MIGKDDAKATLEFLAEATREFLARTVPDMHEAIGINFKASGGISSPENVATSFGDIPDRNLSRGFSLSVLADVPPAVQCGMVSALIGGVTPRFRDGVVHPRIGDVESDIPDSVMKRILENCATGLVRAIPNQEFFMLEHEDPEISDWMLDLMRSIRKTGRMPRFNGVTGHRYDWNHIESRHDDTELVRMMESVFDKCMLVDGKMRRYGPGLVDIWNRSAKDDVALGLLFIQKKAGDGIRILFEARYPGDVHPFIKPLGNDMSEEALLAAMERGDTASVLEAANLGAAPAETPRAC